VAKSTKNKINFKTDKTIKFFIGLITIITITAMFPRYESIEADYSVGMVWSKEDLIAPFSFPIYKSEVAYQLEGRHAKEKALPVFDLLSAVTGNNWLDSLNKFFVNAKKVVDFENALNLEKNLPEEKKTTNPQTFLKMRNELAPGFKDDDWTAFSALYSSQQNQGTTLDAFRKKIIQSLNQVYDRKIIDVPKSGFKTKQVSYIKNKVEETLDLSTVSDVNEIEQQLRIDSKSYFKNDNLVNAAVIIAGKNVYPDLKYNKNESDKIAASLTDAVPKTFGIVRENERIVSKHEQISESTRLKLESYKKVRNEQMGSRDFYSQQAGRFLFVTIMLVLLIMFLYKMRPLIFEDNMRLILLSTIILFQCLLSYLSLNIKVNYPIEFMIFVPVAAMLLTIIFDSRLSVYTIVIICILVSAVRGGDYDILIPNFAASVLVVYSVRDVNTYRLRSLHNCNRFGAL